MSALGPISSVSDSEPKLLPLPWGCGLGRAEQPALQGTRWDWRLGRDLRRRDTRLMRGNTPLPLKAPLPASSTVREYLRGLKGKQREHLPQGTPHATSALVRSADFLSRVWSVSKALKCTFYLFIPQVTDRQGL